MPILALLLNFKKIDIQSNTKNIIEQQIPDKAVILFGIINWGLGHATRSIPLIKTLLSKGHTLHIVSDGLPLLWLKKEIPDVVFHEMKPSFFVYPTRFMWLNAVILLPRFLYYVRNNKKYAEKLVYSTGANIIISDNRFGFRCPDIPLNIYITHQLTIHHDNLLVQNLLSKGHQYFIKKYDQCWVPDFKNNRFAGKLSFTNNLKNIFYLGPLSRFRPNYITDKKYDILVLISGPEPQRSYFEEKILISLREFHDKNICLVRGTDKPFSTDTHIIKTLIHLADTKTLEKIIAESGIIICRSGYSTIMDLDQFNKKVILVATPGQTEQEYLAEYHSSEREKYFSVEQNDLPTELPNLLKNLM